MWLPGDRARMPWHRLRAWRANNAQACVEVVATRCKAPASAYCNYVPPSVLRCRTPQPLLLRTVDCPVATTARHHLRAADKRLTLRAGSCACGAVRCACRLACCRALPALRRVARARPSAWRPPRRGTPSTRRSPRTARRSSRLACSQTSSTQTSTTAPRTAARRATIATALRACGAARGQACGVRDGALTRSACAARRWTTGARETLRARSTWATFWTDSAPRRAPAARLECARRGSRARSAAGRERNGAAARPRRLRRARAAGVPLPGQPLPVQPAARDAQRAPKVRLAAAHVPAHVPHTCRTRVQ